MRGAIARRRRRHGLGSKQWRKNSIRHTRKNATEKNVKIWSKIDFPVHWIWANHSRCGSEIFYIHFALSTVALVRDSKLMANCFALKMRWQNAMEMSSNRFRPTVWGALQSTFFTPPRMEKGKKRISELRTWFKFESIDFPNVKLAAVA